MIFGYFKFSAMIFTPPRPSTRLFFGVSAATTALLLSL